MQDAVKIQYDDMSCLLALKGHESAAVLGRLSGSLDHAPSSFWAGRGRPLFLLGRQMSSSTL